MWALSFDRGGVDGRDVAVAQDVITALLTTGVKLEQERW